MAGVHDEEARWVPHSTQTEFVFDQDSPKSTRFLAALVEPSLSRAMITVEFGYSESREVTA